MIYRTEGEINLEVHPIDKENIRMSAGGVSDLIARGTAPTVTVRGSIIDPAVSLDLDYHSGNADAILVRYDE